MSSIRTIRGMGVASEPLWEAQEFYSPSWDTKPGDTTYWLSTMVSQAGFIQHREMKEVIAFHLMYAPETDIIRTSWGRNVYMRNLVPSAIADLAIKELTGEK